MTWLRWRDLRVSQDGRRLLRVEDLTLEGPGLVLILGATGCGKTTMLRSATRQEVALEHCQVTGEVEAVDASVAYLPQDAADAFLAADPHNEFTLRARGRGLRVAAARRWAQETVKAARPGSQAPAPFVRMSAGERKRWATVAVQAHDPHVLLLDEPFTHLDAAERAAMAATIRQAARSKLALVATHEPRALLEGDTRCIVLREGRPVFDGSGRELEARSSAFGELVLEREPQPPPAPAGGGNVRLRVEGGAFERGGRTVATGVRFGLGDGLHTLEGPNGAGKSTILRALQGLGGVAGGSVDVAGGPADGTRSAYLVEEPTAAFCTPTVTQEILFGLHDGPSGCDAQARLRQALADFDLVGLAQRHPCTLSGGERTRLALACLDALDRPVLLLDEPTSGLDGTGRAILRGFLERRRHDHTLLVATQDPHVAAWGQTRHVLSEGRWTIREAA